jgi:hypothetical protein
MLKYLCWKTISNNILNQITSEFVFKLTSNIYLLKNVLKPIL